MCHVHHLLRFNVFRAHVYDHRSLLHHFVISTTSNSRVERPASSASWSTREAVELDLSVAIDYVASIFPPTIQGWGEECAADSASTFDEENSWKNFIVNAIVTLFICLDFIRNVRI